MIGSGRSSPESGPPGLGYSGGVETHHQLYQLFSGFVCRVYLPAVRQVRSIPARNRMANGDSCGPFFLLFRHAAVAVGVDIVGDATNLNRRFYQQ